MAILVGAALVFLLFPAKRREEEEEELLAQYQAEDTAAGAPAGASGDARA